MKICQTSSKFVSSTCPFSHYMTCNRWISVIITVINKPGGLLDWMLKTNVLFVQSLRGGLKLKRFVDKHCVSKNPLMRKSTCNLAVRMRKVFAKPGKCVLRVPLTFIFFFTYF